MENVTFKSKKPLDEKEQELIRCIMRESNCPHESFNFTFYARYRGRENNIFLFDDGERTIETVIWY